MSLVDTLATIVRPRAAILLYDRITEASPDSQLLGVSRKNFAEQLDVIRQVGLPARLSDVSHSPERRLNGKPFVVVTFDDGYADNLHHAYPLLEHFSVPATVFVSTGFVTSQTELPHDELEKIFLQPGRLPATLQLNVADRSYHWDLGDDAEYGEAAFRTHRHWNVLNADMPTERHRVYRSVFNLLMPLSSDQRAQCLPALLDWAQASPAARPSHRPLSKTEVVQLHSKGLVEIGGHTVTHPLLASQTEAVQRTEISSCRTDLEAMVQAPVRSFAYPYGGRSHYGAASVAAVRDAGFTTACANVMGLVSKGSDPWQLPRLVVRDWPGPVFRERLQSWLH